MSYTITVAAGRYRNIQWSCSGFFASSEVGHNDVKTFTENSKVLGNLVLTGDSFSVRYIKY